MNVIRDLLSRHELISNLVSRELKLRYRGSLLGFLWSILIPLFMALIYVFFLRLLGGRGVPLADIIIGVFAWQFTVQCVNGGLGAITGSANLVKKVAFPRVILPLSATLANLVTYLLSLTVQFALVAVLFLREGTFFSPFTLALPLVIAFHFIFNLALALLLSGINVYVRDAQHLVGVGLSAWFFVSPVMYNLGFIEKFSAKHPWAMDIFLLNPMAVIITAYRSVITPGVSMPWLPAVGVTLGVTGLLLWLSYRVFDRLQKDFADLL